MPLDNRGIGAGNAFGNAISKALKPKTAGKTLGRTVGKTSKPRRTQPYRGGGSGGSRRGIPENRGGGGSSGGGRSYPEKTNPRRGIPERGAPSPSNPSIDAYLGTDSAYQNVVRGGKRSLADFLSEMGRRRGESTTQFNQTKASMERDRIQQLEAMRDEFASRGLIQSGLFGEEQGKFQQQFTEQQSVLSQQQAALLADLLSQEKNFRREQDLALEAARQEALARRAAKYKIGA